jgi:hypothetical protein
MTMATVSSSRCASAGSKIERPRDARLEGIGQRCPAAGLRLA